MEREKVYLLGWEEVKSGKVIPTYCEELELGNVSPRKYNFLLYSFGNFKEVIDCVENFVTFQEKFVQKLEKEIGFYPHSMNTGKALLDKNQEKLMKEKAEIIDYIIKLNEAIEGIKSNNGNYNKKLEDSLNKS